ncbi:MAG: hypothetical protein JST00_07785 [Deltaproteobacteria bacterium]|nr:hypothetical protein [Deltaproteobacteria bacterium]
MARAVTKALLLSTASLVAVSVIVACSSTSGGGTTPPPADTDAGPDAEVDSEPSDTGPADAGACVLAARTGKASCDECLTTRCCTVINACLDDPPCDRVNTCYAGCNRLGPQTDAGVQCVRDCVAGKDREAAMLLEMLECQNQRCGTLCKQ